MSPLVFMLVLMLKLLIVHDVQVADQEAVVTFEDGQKAKLLKSDASYEMSLKLAKRSQERKAPVGVSLEKDKPEHITEMVRADADVVLEAGPSEADKNVWRVRMQAHQGIFSLKINHPDFKRISELLTDSVKNKTKLWFVWKPDLSIEDSIKVEVKKTDKKDSSPPPGEDPKKDDQAPKDKAPATPNDNGNKSGSDQPK